MVRTSFSSAPRPVQGSRILKGPCSEGGRSEARHFSDSLVCLSLTDEVDTSIIAPFIQEALDGLEFAKGLANSKWGPLLLFKKL
ncbi:hypothetical protein DEO72_LG4g841 [Vigna unguiculata]|uniref:Uncharacterized protein n=1 Tax=Vigna unguiculata TaxID=3917 RepID=A0A4D6LM67_VIGUN|nr:hypothetical protein DEO72_LG4g841 [Vigna unguiculata]